MKERFIQEITNSMAEFLDIEQLATLNGVIAPSCEQIHHHGR